MHIVLFFVELDYESVHPHHTASTENVSQHHIAFCQHKGTFYVQYVSKWSLIKSPIVLVIVYLDFSTKKPEKPLYLLFMPSVRNSSSYAPDHHVSTLQDLRVAGNEDL